MRLHRLEVTGFGPFRERQVVDFDAFADDGIFLIAGRTGAGKSSVLDGVTFGLYGGVPRYDGSERRLRSDHCAPEDPTVVSVEFSAAGCRWRVTRSPEYERPKQRGSGMTTEPHRAQLDELVAGDWIGRAARPVDVARELDEILGLSQQQFLQVILLAQNRFAEFLLSKNDDRQRLLRRLFGTRTYEGYQAALEQRRKDAEGALAAAGDGVGLLLGEAERLLAAEALGSEAVVADAPPIVDRLQAARLGVQRAQYRVEALVRERDEADAAHRAAETAHAAAKTLREKQERRVRSRAALAALEDDAPAISADRETLARAHAAEALRAPIATAADAVAEELHAGERLTELLAGWHEGDAGAAPTRSDLESLVEELTGDLAVWAVAETREAELSRAAADLAAGSAQAAEFDQLVERLDLARQAFPARLTVLEVELGAAQGTAGGRDAAAARLADVRGRLAAARDAEKLAEVLRDVEADYLRATAAHDDARREVTSLLQRRLAGHASELAANLVDGEPCAVCGATAHPSPAPATDDPVSDDAVDAAEAARDAAATIEASAGTRAKTARDAHAAAAAQAGGDDAATLTAALAEAEASLAAAAAAVVRRDALSAEREDLIAAEAEARREHEALSKDLGELRERLAGLTIEVETARRAVEEARGDHDSVAARIAAARERRAQATALLEAQGAVEVAGAHARRAERDRDARVSASDFDDVEDAAAALRDEVARDALEARIHEHEIALRTERDRLRDLELDLAGEPEELVDLASAARGLAEARDRWSAAVDRAAHGSQTSERLADLVERAAAAHEAIGGLADDHAVIARLSNTVAGRPPNTHRMTLESFVLAAELEEIVEAANLRLADMSAGRYRLQHSDALAARGASSGLGLEIMDAHTGMARPAQSLSGGETFLASLALALGLAEVVTARAGGVRLDTLFIDEGFGSLDDDTLELAMRTLDELRQGGRTVGLISHVAAMKEQLPAQLSVVATPQGPSVIRQDAPAVLESVTAGAVV